MFLRISGCPAATMPPVTRLMRLMFGTLVDFVQSMCAPAGMVGIGLVLSATIPTLYAAQQVAGHPSVLDTQIGDATLYAARFEGRKTASGLIFEGDKAMAAHRSYPFGTVVRVTYLRNRRSVTVVIVDRGPYGKNRQEGAIIDLSPVAAKRLGMLRVGQARVKLEVLAWGNGKYLN